MSLRYTPPRARQFYDPAEYQARFIGLFTKEAAQIRAIRARPMLQERDWSQVDPEFHRWLKAQWDADLDGMSAASDVMGCAPHPRTVL